MTPKWLGPFEIVENLPLQNVVVIKRETGFMEKVNIRRVTPYTEPLVGQDVVSRDTHETNKDGTKNVDDTSNAKIFHYPPVNERLLGCLRQALLLNSQRVLRCN